MKTKKKSLEKESHNFRLKLRENILTTSPMTITSKNNNNNIQNIKFDTSENQSKTPSYFSSPNSTQRKLFSLSLLKYKPKRLIQFKGINIPLPSLGKASLDYSKTFNIEKTIDEKNKTIVTFDSDMRHILKNNNNDLNKIIKNENTIEFKNKYILKFAEYSDAFSKLSPLNNIIDDTRKIEFKDLYGKIAKSLELQSQLLLDDIQPEFRNGKTGNKNSIFINPYSTATTSSSLSKEGVFSNNKINNNFNVNDKIKQIIFLISDYNNYIIKFLYLLKYPLFLSNNFTNENISSLS